MINIIPFYYDDYDDLYSNCYVLFDENKKAVVIDPSKQYSGIVNYLKKNNLELTAILLTHGHFDHMRGVNTLLENFPQAELYIGFDDEKSLTDSELNCAYMCYEEVSVKCKDAKLLADNEIIKVISEPIMAISTPYHTKGSMCYYLKDSKAIFTGDFIFKRGIGRSDLPNAAPREFPKSVEKIKRLDTNIVIYPGHGHKSTLKDELIHNPYLKYRASARK